MSSSNATEESALTEGQPASDREGSQERKQPVDKAALVPGVVANARRAKRSEAASRRTQHKGFG